MGRGTSTSIEVVLFAAGGGLRLAARGWQAAALVKHLREHCIDLSSLFLNLFLPLRVCLELARNNLRGTPIR